MNRFLIYLSVFIIVSVTSVTLPPSALPAEEADKICPRCNAVYPADSNFCTTDGMALVEQEVVLQCPKCGRMGRIAEIFCPLDGERMTPAGEKVRERKAKEKALAIEYYKEGNKLSDQRDYDKALEKYLEAERLYPDFPELQHNMGWACSKLGNLPDAVYHLRRYINLNPEADDFTEVLSYITMMGKTLEGEERRNKIAVQRDKVMQESLAKNRDKWGMTLIPSGDFVMGIVSRREDSGPPHTVYMPAFYMDKYEVTNAQYYEFLEYIKETGDHSKCHKDEVVAKDHTPRQWEDAYYDNPEFPVSRIDWYDAHAYAAWAGKRLPTEAEWEKAARGPNSSWWPWGNEWDPRKCNVGEDPAPTPVGSFEEGKSAYGCYDMAGSVAEWASDWYGPFYYASSPSNNPKGPEKGLRKILRGGSRFGQGFLLRSTNRRSELPNVHNQSVGFRCAKDPS